MPFLMRVDGVAIEIGGALLEFSEVFHRAQAALRSMNLLVEDAAQARPCRGENGAPGAGYPGRGETALLCAR